MKSLKFFLIFAFCLLPFGFPQAKATDVSVTAASVAYTSGQKSTGTAGATITAGEPLYTDSSGNLQPAKADTAVHSACVGIALNGAATGQPIVYQTSGTITYNAGFTVGLVYCVAADTAGSIAPFGDLTTGNYVTILGVAQSTTVLQLSINVSGIHQ